MGLMCLRFNAAAISMIDLIKQVEQSHYRIVPALVYAGVHPIGQVRKWFRVMSDHLIGYARCLGQVLVFISNYGKESLRKDGELKWSC